MGSGKGKSRRAQAVAATPSAKSESKAREAFRKATAPARKTYDAAAAQAEKAWHKDLTQAGKIRRTAQEQAKALFDQSTVAVAAYEKAVAPIDEEYHRVVDKAHQEHDAAIAQATQEHDDEVAAPWATHKEALLAAPLPEDWKQEIRKREKAAERHNKAVLEARTAANQARGLEWDKYQKSIAPEKKALDLAREQAEKIFRESAEKREAILAQAEAEAMKEYEKATAPAWATYQSAASKSAKKN